MIINRRHFDIHHKAVIEKLLIQTPFRYEAVFQNEACFLYFKDGQSTLSSPTENLSVLPLESVLLNCGNYIADLVQHATSGHCELFIVHLYPDLLKEIYQHDLPAALPSTKGKPYVNKIAGEPIIHHFIHSLEFYFDNPEIVTEELLLLKLKELILLLLQTDQSETITTLFARLFTHRQVALQDVVQAHLYSNLSIVDLATLAALSLSSFKRAFEDYYGESPARYIKQKKLQKAMQLLSRTQMPISDIGYEVGFASQSHFSRAFRQAYQQSPQAYRSMNTQALTG